MEKFAAIIEGIINRLEGFPPRIARLEEAKYKFNERIAKLEQGANKDGCEKSDENRAVDVGDWKAVIGKHVRYVCGSQYFSGVVFGCTYKNDLIPWGVYNSNGKAKWVQDVYLVEDD
jgi:hypothetical protein